MIKNKHPLTKSAILRFIFKNYLLIILFFLILFNVSVYLTIKNQKITNNKNNSQRIQISNKNNVPVINSLKIGLYINNHSPETYQDELEGKVSILTWFRQWNNPLANNQLINACNQGYLPLITWESWNGISSFNKNTNYYPLSDIASGKFDNYIKNNIKDIGKYCPNQTVIIRFDQEMDTPEGVISWYPWQGNPTDYVAAWKHIVKISRNINPNIKWLWSPNRGAANTPLYFPGDNTVDYVGITLDHEIIESYITSFAEFYNQNRVVIESFNKPVIISETTSEESIAGKSIWINDMFNYVKSNDMIVALDWYNGGPSDEDINSSPSSLAAFKNNLQNL